MSRRLLAVLGTSACLTAALLSAVAAAFRSFDRALSDYTVELRNVPAEWQL